MIRQKRKISHVHLAVQTEERAGDTWFNDVTLVYNALPELDYASIDTAVDFFGKKLATPILINAMTGGHPDVEPINRSLASDEIHIITHIVKKMIQMLITQLKE